MTRHVRVRVSPADLAGMEARVKESGIRGAVVSREQLESVGPEAVVLQGDRSAKAISSPKASTYGIKIRRSALSGVVARVVRNSLFKTKLVDDALAAVLDVEQTQTGVAREAEVEREVHYVHDISINRPSTRVQG